MANTDNNKRRVGAGATEEAARECFVKAQSIMTWQNHWEAKGRRRDFDNLCGRLSGHARKCGAILVDDRAAALFEDLFNFVEQLERRQACIDNFRNHFLAFALRDLGHFELK